MNNVEYIDTSSIVDLSKELLYLNNEYLIEVNQLYNKLTNMPYETLEWVGNKAEEYSKRCALEKENLLNMYNNLSEYTKMLQRFAEDYEEVIIKNTRVEESI